MPTPTPAEAAMLAQARANIKAMQPQLVHLKDTGGVSSVGFRNLMDMLRDMQAECDAFSCGSSKVSLGGASRRSRASASLSLRLTCVDVDPEEAAEARAAIQQLEQQLREAEQRGDVASEAMRILQSELATIKRECAAFLPLDETSEPDASGFAGGSGAVKGTASPPVSFPELPVCPRGPSRSSSERDSPEDVVLLEAPPGYAEDANAPQQAASVLGSVRDSLYSFF